MLCGLFAYSSAICCACVVVDVLLESASYQKRVIFGVRTLLGANNGTDCLYGYSDLEQLVPLQLISTSRQAPVHQESLKGL